MSEVINTKKLEKIISTILEEEVKLQSFVFFLNKLENVNSSIDKIVRVLRDYLLLCKNELPKGKKRVRTLKDRFSECNENNESGEVL